MLFNINETGISGSITRLVTGESYIVAGEGINVTTGSNGQVTVASQGNTSGSFDWSTLLSNIVNSSVQ